MGRKRSDLFHIFYRSEAVWIWWADGKGGKSRKRVLDASGIGVNTDSPEIEQKEWANRTYYRWCDDSAPTPSRNKEGQNPLTLGELTALYVESQGKWWDEQTIEAYILFLDLLHNFFGTQSAINSINHELALSFMANLREERIGSGATDRKYLGFYKYLFEYAVKLGRLQINPFLTIRSAYKKKNPPIKDAFTPDEIRALLEAAKSHLPWFTPVLTIAALTGAHQDELTHLKVSDVHFRGEQSFLKIRNEIAKGGNGRTFGLPGTVAAMLHEYLRDRELDEFLFLSGSKKKLARNTFNQSTEGGRVIRPWRKVLNAANIRTRRFNCVRQSVDTNLTSRAGIESSEAAKYVGHTESVSRSSYQDRPLDISRKRMETMCQMYGMEEADGEQFDHWQTQDIYPGKETLDLVG